MALSMSEVSPGVRSGTRAGRAALELAARNAAASADGGTTRVAVVTDEVLLESDDGGYTFTVVLGH
jgi:hypothetical protein